MILNLVVAYQIVVFRRFTSVSVNKEQQVLELPGQLSTTEGHWERRMDSGVTGLWTKESINNNNKNITRVYSSISKFLCFSREKSF